MRIRSSCFFALHIIRRAIFILVVPSDIGVHIFGVFINEIIVTITQPMLLGRTLLKCFLFLIIEIFIIMIGFNLISFLINNKTPISIENIPIYIVCLDDFTGIEWIIIWTCDILWKLDRTSLVTIRILETVKDRIILPESTFE